MVAVEGIEPSTPALSELCSTPELHCYNFFGGQGKI